MEATAKLCDLNQQKLLVLPLSLYLMLPELRQPNCSPFPLPSK